MSEALRIAIVGAESTGKTTLAAGLATQLATPARRVAWVPEVLREWCERQGRTPRVDEQAGILAEQHARLDAAALAHDVVVCDTTALMTAVYSRLIFGDRSLEALAVALHRGMHATLLTAIDLPWVADGHQRDGPQVREPVDQALRELMNAHGIGFAVIGGNGRIRVDRARDAVAKLLTSHPTAPTQDGNAPRPGLFTRLNDPDAVRSHGRWDCECCVPEHERTLQRSRRVQTR